MNLVKSLALSCALAALSLMTANSGWCIDVDVAEAPINDLALTVNAINSAQHTLQLNVYELSSPEIADALMNRIQAGVQVQILVDGQPVGGMSAASKGIVSELVGAMQQQGTSGDFLYEMTSKAGAKRRYRYDHAKYIVVDGQALLIGSENYSPTGNPEPGTLGNRGWEALIHSPDLAQAFQQTFASDSDLSYGDVMDMGAQGVAYAFGLTDDPAKKPYPFQNSAAPAPLQADAQTLTASAVTSFTSPNTSLSGLQAIFAGAKSSIDIELMTFHQDWGHGGGQSPLLSALLAAAQRGVHIRVLLNDESVFNVGGKWHSKPINPLTIQALQDAAAQGLPIEAHVANIKAMGVDYIHNKGLLADGNMSMISSINWDENSVEHNREAAVVITSADVYNHYEALFEHDWEVSGGSPNQASPLLSQGLREAQASELSLPGAVAADSVNCPSALRVAVQIGQVAIEQGVDKSFATLSNTSFTLNMVRDKSSRSCIFLSGAHANPRRVLEIRGSHGEILFDLEGFTGDGKVYSIRARADAPVHASQDLAAHLYDGSGPAHGALADVDMVIDAR